MRNTLIKFALVLALPLAACSASLTPAQEARVNLLECRANALMPYVDGIMDAEQLVRDVYAGKASIDSVIQSLKLAQDEMMSLYMAFQECSPTSPVTAPVEAPVEVPN